MEWKDILIRIFAAVLVGGIIGVEREYKNRPAGMRTHVLVCLGACIIAMLECLLRDELIAQGAQNVALSMGRMCAQVISGIGFLGAGTIFIAQKKIAGLTTAASLWNVACLGLAVGLGYYVVALVGCVIVVVVLSLFQRIIRVNAIKRVEVKFIHRVDTLAFINAYFEKMDIKVLDLDFHLETSKDVEGNLYTNLYTLHLPFKTSYTDIVNRLAEHPNVQSVRTRNT